MGEGGFYMLQLVISDFRTKKQEFLIRETANLSNYGNREPNMQEIVKVPSAFGGNRKLIRRGGVFSY